MEGFCKGCLIKFDDPAELLQYTEKNRRMFIYCTGLQVKRNDALTLLLCKECYLNMKLSCKFKKQCRNSDKKLKNYLALKDIGDNIDFCTFIKNNDDNLTFRLPMLSGNSTPANQKCKDDDNESTCTSIRNFMTDILQGEEVPDTEARIIRELIEEEADLLDDSLDSHWLRDDISIDTDFRLDLSFSPFSTPRSVNNDHCYTPKKENDPQEQYEQINYFTSNDRLENNGEVLNKVDALNKDLKVVNEHENVANHTEYENGITIDNHDRQIDNGELKDDGDLIEYVDLIDSTELQGKNALNYYIEDIDFIDQTKGQNDINCADNGTVHNNVCSIDKNLEEALKNETNKAFSLDELLLSPPVFSNVTAPSTPTISNILFGDKLDIGENNTTGQNIENYDNVEGDVDILEEFFQNDTAEMNEDDAIKNKPAEFIDMYEENTKDIEIYNLNTLFCMACKKQFKTAKALKKHLTNKHQITLKKTNDYSIKVCNECGKTFSGRANLHRHMKTHKTKPEKPEEIFKCEYCPIECVSLKLLKMHMKTHTGIYVCKDTGKKYVCTICNAVSNTLSNFNLHQRRHKKDYSQVCNECNKGFYRAYDFKKHMKCCSGIIGTSSFICKHCSLEYNSLARLNLHLKTHGCAVKNNISSKYVCPTCGAKISTLTNFNTHLKRHRRNYTHNCEECDKRFYSSYDLNNHMRRHTGERPFQCEQCNKKFSRRHDLVIHLKNHIGEKQFSCDHCKKSFVRKALLIQHLNKSKLCYEDRTMMPYESKYEEENSFECSPKTVEDNNVEYLYEISGASKEFMKQMEAGIDDQYLAPIKEDD